MARTGRFTTAMAACSRYKEGSSSSTTTGLTSPGTMKRLSGLICAPASRCQRPCRPPGGACGPSFPETGHAVGGKFRAYWERHGGLAQQGYPLSDEFTEVSALNGQPYTVQYFERAVFELHPENASPGDVLLSQLGTFRYHQV